MLYEQTQAAGGTPGAADAGESASADSANDDAVDAEFEVKEEGSSK
jgi:hypothetical protein